MPKVKYDVSGSDPERATQGMRKSPRPGMYAAKVAEVNVGYSRGDSGKPDKERPRLEIIYEMVKADKPKNDKYKGSRIWEYIRIDHEPQAWKMDQFLQAVGLATKKKRKGTLDTDTLKGKRVLVVVRAGQNLRDEYKGEAAQVLAWDAEAFKQAKEEAEDETEDEFDSEGIEGEDFEDDDSDEDEEDEEEEEEEEEDEDDDEELDDEEPLEEDEEEEEEAPKKKTKKVAPKKTKTASTKKKSGGSSKKGAADDDDWPFS